MSRTKIKTYKVKLYEVEVLYLYRLLLGLKKGKMPLTESRFKEIIENNDEFRIWDEYIKEWENKK